MAEVKIDWTNPKFRLTEHFTVKDAIWLPQWSRLSGSKPEDKFTATQKANLIFLLKEMEIVRAFLSKEAGHEVPIVAHVCLRPKAYNTLVKGAKNSAHLFGMALDWSAPAFGSCDDIRKTIVPMLPTWKLRCEDLPGSGWVHNDFRDPGPGGRWFFKP